MENSHEVRELAAGKTMYADKIVTFIKKTNKSVQDFFWSVDFDKVDFHGCSSMYTIEKIDSLISYLQFLKKGLKNK